MASTRYSMSFTTGTLLYQESVMVAGIYEELEDWDAVREAVVSENLLQMRTLNASRRTYREISSRLKLLTQEQMVLLRDGSRHEQNFLLWLAVCKRYRFIYDFAIEVVREKYLRMDLELSGGDYDVYFSNKAEWHPEVDGITESTRKKGRQVIFKMLREAELLTEAGRIIPALLSPRLIEVISEDDPAHFAIYPISSADIMVWTP